MKAHGTKTRSHAKPRFGVNSKIAAKKRTVPADGDRRPDGPPKPELFPVTRDGDGAIKKAKFGVGPKPAKKKVGLGASGALPADGAYPNFSYYGGLIINTPQVYTVFIGDWTSAANQTRAGRLNQFITDLMDSTYMNILSQYGCGATGKLVGSVFIPNSNQNLADTDLHTIIQNAINGGTLPEPIYGSTVYILYLDDNTGIKDPGIGIVMCEATNDNAFGYHYSFKTAAGNYCPYAVVPGLTNACLQNSCPSDGGCSLHLAQTQEQRQTQVTSHEFSEMISDPLLNAWFDPSWGENGDLCNGQHGTITVGPNQWNVQLMYSKTDDMRTGGATTCISSAAFPLAPLINTTWDLVGNPFTNPQVNFLGTADNQPLVIKTNGAEAMRVDEIGRVIIDRGWTHPGESLLVKHSEDGRAPGVTFSNEGGGHFVQQFLFTNPNANLPGGVAATLWANWTGLVVSAQRAMSFVIGSFDTPSAQPGQFQFAGGNVAVGNPTPGVKLSVSGVEYSDHGGQAAIAISNVGNAGANWYLRAGADNGNGNRTYTSPGGFSIADDSAYRFMIDNAGNAAVGPTEDWMFGRNDPDGVVNRAKLTVYGDLKVTGNIILDGYVFCQRPDPGDSLHPGKYRQLVMTSDPFPPPDQIAIWYNWHTLSDERLKRDIAPLPGALDILKQLRGVSFYWNEDGVQHLTRGVEKYLRSASGKPEDDQTIWQEERNRVSAKLADRQIGFVAQDFEKVFPDRVCRDDQGYSRINTQHLDAIIVNAINEQQEVIQALRQEIVDLRAAQKQMTENWETRFKQLEQRVASTSAP